MDGETMKAIVLDRAERVVGIENVKRDGQIVSRKEGTYTLRGVSWAWATPAIPWNLYVLQFVPFIGPFLAMRLLTRQTVVLITPGVNTTLEPRDTNLINSITDRESLSIMEAHAEASSLASRRMSFMEILAVGSIAIAVIAVLGVLF